MTVIILLRVVIQELRDCVKALRDDNDYHDKKIEAHGKEINDLKGRVDKVELQVKMYHDHE